MSNQDAKELASLIADNIGTNAEFSEASVEKIADLLNLHVPYFNPKKWTDSIYGKAEAQP